MDTPRANHSCGRNGPAGGVRTRSAGRERVEAGDADVEPGEPGVQAGQPASGAAPTPQVAAPRAAAPDSTAQQLVPAQVRRKGISASRTGALAGSGLDGLARLL